MPDLITKTNKSLEAIELLYFAYREFTAEPDKILAQRGLNRVHHRILYFVGRHEGISVSALLEILRVSKQALNAPLRQLVHMGLVSNEADPNDRRVKQLKLTRTGKALEQRLSGTQLKLLAKVFDDSGDNATDGWYTVMRNLKSD